MTEKQSRSARKRDAIILGAAILVWGIAMSVHPHGNGPPVLWRFSLSTLVHGVALLVKPALIYGFWKLAEWQGVHRQLVGLALSFFVMGQVAMLSAGTVSGWIAPSLWSPIDHHAAVAGHTGTPTLMHLVRFSHSINQGYANVYVILVSTAILLLALGWRGGGAVDLAVKWAGITIGGGLLLWQLSGLFSPSPLLMMVVAAAHTSWILLAAAVFGWLGSRFPETEHA